GADRTGAGAGAGAERTGAGAGAEFTGAGAGACAGVGGDRGAPPPPPRCRRPAGGTGGGGGEAPPGTGAGVRKPCIIVPSTVGKPLGGARTIPVRTTRGTGCYYRAGTGSGA